MVSTSEDCSSRVEELHTVHSPILPGIVYVCDPGFTVSITQVGEIKRVRSETANSSGLNTLFSELAVVQSYALVVHTVGVVLSGMAGSDARDGAKGE